MTKRICYTLCCFLLFPLFLCGCCSDGLIFVSGNITLDGQSLSEGMIMFIPSGTNGNSASAIISGGKYNVRVSPCKMIVRIFAERPYTDEEIKKLRANPMYNNDPMFNPEKMKKQYIPEKYNEKSILSAEIQENTRELNFELKSSEN
ncbi:MAG: hypothetical protein LBK82_03425 [Planctomycetaceae bacterium]|jgi:hypothetical protein|nr:hypothetical protein [Planctomycetaceae bacterium]